MQPPCPVGRVGGTLGTVVPGCEPRQRSRKTTTDWCSGTRSRRYWRWVCSTAACSPACSVARLLAQRGHLGLELEHPLHAGQVEALAGELLDAAQQGDVGVAVAAAAPAGAGRVDQALALVDAQGLGVHAGQLGGHRDDVDGPCGALRRTVGGGFGHGPHTPRWARGDSPSDAAGAPRRALRSARRQLGRHRHLDGDEQVARGPSAPPTPLPFTRNVRPERVPAGMRSVTGPSSRVGTVMSAPRAASAKVTGTVRVRSRPLRRNSGCGRDAHDDVEVAGRAAVAPGPPRPFSRMRWPSSTPGGDAHLDLAGPALDAGAAAGRARVAR